LLNTLSVSGQNKIGSSYTFSEVCSEDGRTRQNSAYFLLNTFFCFWENKTGSRYTFSGVSSEDGRTRQNSAYFLLNTFFCAGALQGALCKQNHQSLPHQRQHWE
jgi:rRNA maturation protein Nop10